MEQPTALEINSLHVRPDGSQEQYRFSVAAMADTLHDVLRLRYSEPPEHDMEGETCWTIFPSRAILKRSGAIDARMVFEVGKEYTMPYRSVYGAMFLTSKTQFLNYTPTETGGIFTLHYALFTDDEPLGATQLSIEMKYV